MDKWLAEIYGTGGGEDLEKTAQAALLQKLAEEEGISLEGLSPDQLSALSAEVLGNGAGVATGGEPTFDAQNQGVDPALAAQAVGQPMQGGIVPPGGFQQQVAPQMNLQQQAQQLLAAQQGQQLEMQAQQQLQVKEAEAKFAEADFLGRVMAHAYNQELQKIASAAQIGKGSFVARNVAKGKHLAGHAAKHVGGFAKKHKWEGAAAAGGGAAGFAAGHHGKNKEASAFEKLAEMRANEMLSAVGVDPSTGQDVQPAQTPEAAAQAMQGQQGAQGQQPQAGAQPGMMAGSPQAQQGQPQMAGQGQQDPQFEEALNTRALEMLQAAGWDPSQIVGALTGQGQEAGAQQ